jgi:hypothetical protein
LATAGFLADEARKENLPTVYELGCAFVGFEAAVALRDFVEKYERQVTVEMILNEGQIEKTAEFGINDHSALVEKMEAEEVFKTELTDGQIQNLGAYFLTLPSEVAMKLLPVLGKGEIHNTVAIHQCKVGDQSVSAYIVDLLTVNAVA